MRRIVILTLVILVSLVVVAQQPDAKHLTVPPRQEIKLERPADSTAAQLAFVKAKNIQLQFQILQKQIQEQQQTLQTDFNGYQAQLAAWVAQAKKNNHLGDDVQYDPEQDKWFKTTVQPAPKEKSVVPAHF
jgi:uncharacterized membrane protein